MTSEFIFYLIVGILVFNFLLETSLDYLNASRFDAQLPEGLRDLYDKEDYLKSQAYKKEKFKFGTLQSIFSITLILVFLSLDGFGFVNEIAHRLFDHPIFVSLSFLFILFFGGELISTPFDYYFTFRIEERYGFNTSTQRLFWLDKLKSIFIAFVFGGIILGLILLVYSVVGSNFWWYAWILIAVLSVFLNMFYAKLIVPFFNKQTPLEKGELRSQIQDYASSMKFNLKNIFVIDGSKRSQKANAYFSGFGNEKRITLFDTLIKDLDIKEIVAVLAHEVGHYKKHHIIINLFVSLISIGFMLWLFSLFIEEPVLSQALGIEQPSFHVGLVAFSFLYAPFSLVTGLLTNYLSRVFEFQADDFASFTYSGDYLSSALKKLSKKSLSNLTPHPAYVFFHFSHPPLKERSKNLKNKL
jgi:STE24 endopeptidase